MDTFSPYSVEMLLCCSSAKSKSKKLMVGFFAYQDFTTCSLESRDITLCSSCVADLGVKVIQGEGGEVLRILTRLWSEDSSTSVSIERAKSTKRRKTQSKTTKTEGNQERPKRKTKPRTPTQHKPKKGGEGASVEKPDTSLARQFKHLDTKQEKIKTPEPTN